MTFNTTISSLDWTSSLLQSLGATSLSSSWNSTEFSAECLVLQFKDFIPWDNPDNIISFQVEHLVRKLKDLLVLPICFLIGFPANIINIVIFYKQGLKERVNLCLFALSLADALSLIQNFLFFGEQFYLQFTTKEMYGPVMRFVTNNILTGFYGFIWISQVMSAIIASDRCFCIMRPLRSKSISGISTTTIIIVSVYVVTLSLFFVTATRYYITCAFDPASNSIIMTFVPGQFYIRHQQLVDILDMAVFGAAVPFVVMMLVTIATIITTIKLRQAARWRAETSFAIGLSQRDIALTKMLVSNSTFFIACVSPFCILRLIIFALPELNPGRRHHNLHMTFQWLMVIAAYINSTFNFVVYYTMGSRYRATLWELFRRLTLQKQSKT